MSSVRANSRRFTNGRLVSQLNNHRLSVGTILHTRYSSYISDWNSSHEKRFCQNHDILALHQCALVPPHDAPDRLAPAAKEDARWHHCGRVWRSLLCVRLSSTLRKWARIMASCTAHMVLATRSNDNSYVVFTLADMGFNYNAQYGPQPGDPILPNDGDTWDPALPGYGPAVVLRSRALRLMSTNARWVPMGAISYQRPACCPAQRAGLRLLLKPHLGSCLRRTRRRTAGCFTHRMPSLTTEWLPIAIPSPSHPSPPLWHLSICIHTAPHPQVRVIDLVPDSNAARHGDKHLALCAPSPSQHPCCAHSYRMHPLISSFGLLCLPDPSLFLPHP